MVLVEIYNLAGTKVSTLVNGKQQAGNQQTSYDSSLLAEGVTWLNWRRVISIIPLN